MTNAQAADGEAVLFHLVKPPPQISIFILKFFKQKNINFSDYEVKLTKDSIIFSENLKYDKAETDPQKSPLNFSLNQIIDFETIAGSKNVRPHFKIKLHQSSNSESYQVYNPFSNTEVDQLYKAMHSATGMSDKSSPFSNIARQVRKTKRRLHALMISLGSVGTMLTILLTLLYPPLQAFSFLMSIAVYTLPLSYLLILLFKSTQFYKKKLDAKWGSRAPQALVYFMFIPTVFASIIAINKIAGQEVIDSVTQVTGKKVKSGKSGKNYLLEIDAPLIGEYVFNFNENVWIYVSKKIYNKAIVHNSQLTIVVNMGALQLPILESYKLLPDSNKATPQISKNLDLVNWQAQLPENFPPAEGYNKDYWPNGKIRSDEPLINGQRHGLAKYFFANGSKYTEIYWVHGQKHGRYKTYREDGTLEADYSYNMGKVHGKNIWYDDKGQVKQVSIYRYGEYLN